MPAITFYPRQQLLKQTTTRCPLCLQPIPGQVWREGTDPARVVLRRTCPTHGDFEATLATDARFYWISQGDPANACCQSASPVQPATGTLGRNAAGHPNNPFEVLSTCIALIEIVHSCNLSCPTCYAESPVGIGNAVDAVPLDELKTRIQGIVDRKGGIEILQLSGGEPTLHPQFFELLDWIQAHPDIDFVMLNTNGVRIAKEPDFADRLGIAAKRRGLQVYLQFDGVQPKAQHFLRGADLRALRSQALEVCARLALPVTLAMTVVPENLGSVWEAIAFGLSHSHVQGITFQPMFLSGRSPASFTQSPKSMAPTRLNVADVLNAAINQSDGQLSANDFTPLPCGDPNCATIGYLLRIDGNVRSVSEFLDFSQLQGFLHNKIQYRLEDLAQCGCEIEPLGAVLQKLELQPSVAFRILVKPFMDAWTWDQDRIDRCCTHVIRPDGKLDSFCRYYSGFPDTKPAP